MDTSGRPAFIYASSKPLCLTSNSPHPSIAYVRCAILQCIGNAAFNIGSNTLNIEEGFKIKGKGLTMIAS